MMPFMITFSACAFISAYVAYPKIKEIMIDPYTGGKKQAETASDAADSDTDEETEETETEEA